MARNQKDDDTAKRFHFSVKKLEALPAPAGKPVVYFDDEVPHLGLRCQPTGTRTFVTIKRSAGVTFRKTLGQFPELQIEAARAVARRLLNENAKWKADDYQGIAPLARPVDKAVVTFGKMFEDHVRKVRKAAGTEERAERSEKNLRYVYNPYLSQFENTPLENMTPPRMVDLHAKLAERGPYAANRAIELLRACFNDAMDKGLATADPTRSVEMFPEARRKRFLQPEELLRLEKVLTDESNQDVAEFTKLLLLTGVRKNNLYAARWEEISFERSTWDIPMTKNGESLSVPLSDDAIEIFKAREARRVNGNEWVFPSKANASKHTVDYKSQWVRIRKAAGIPDVRPHDLRRTFASYQAIGGASLQMVGSSLGHKDSKSTEVYSHLVQSAVRQSIDSGEETRKQMMKDAAKRIKADERRKTRKLQVVPVAS
jgi:integrase